MTPEAFQPQIITVRVKQACQLTGIGRSKLYELIAQGELATIKIGAITLLRYDDLQRFVTTRSAGRE